MDNLEKVWEIIKNMTEEEVYEATKHLSELPETFKPDIGRYFEIVDPSEQGE